ncbi:hypothetical protein ACEWY4_005340 [Coilia grayii]|uniref:AAA+ ATPase domain-containing protein n=1 Tax=Coilia grayii TaxID=363190 RepID=A0ABD1KI11_9TELE
MEDTGEYVYCIKRTDDHGYWNPYDLKVVSVQTAKQHSRYWTVSASYIHETAELKGLARLFQPWEPSHESRPLYAQVALWKILLQRFRRFLAMVDYMFETVLSSLLRAAVSALHSALWASYHSAQTDVKLDSGTTVEPEKLAQMTMCPSLNDFVVKIQEVLDGFQSVSEILRMVQTGFSEAECHCATMESFCEMVGTAIILDVSSFLDGEKWTAQDLKAILMAHTESMQRMQKMELQTRVNMMLVNCQQYQRDCLPYPRKLIASIHTLLPDFAQKKNLELMEVIGAAQRKLELDIVTLEEFVDHLNFLSQISTKLPSLERQCNFLVQLYTIVKDFNIMISPEDLALFHHLVSSFSHLKTTVMICETKRDDKIYTCIADLSKQLNKLRHDLVLIRVKINNPLLLRSDTSMEMASEVLQELTEELSIYSNQAYSYFKFRELLGSSFSKKSAPHIANKEDVADSVVEQEVTDVSSALTLRGMLWDMQREWHKHYDLWRTTAFDHLNVNDLQNDVIRFTQTIYILKKGAFSDHILQYSRLISDISTTATHEATLEGMLNKVIDLWRCTDFRLITYNSDTSTVKIIASADDVMTQLDESQTTIMSLKSSRYVEPIKGLIDEWERKLNQFANTLGEWVTCQKRWLYLEPIFSAGGIQRQLPEEAKLFEQVDEVWKLLMLKTEAEPNALRNGTSPGVLEDLQNNNSQLERIQKCLEEYLESKRNIFPRFYFLSNEELINVLTQSRNPSVIQTQIMFGSDCERCLSGGSGQREGLRVLQQQMIGSLEDLMALAFKPLAGHQQATVENLFTILLHCRDVLSHLIQHNITSADDFEWRRQLLYDWHDTTSLCYVVQAKASFPYGYEYQGCSPRLVITPLTDRCWLTLTGALSLHLGGALVGPTATGKTESVKDLAKMMGKLYSGMVQSGAWCCFDEFNSISVKVLSVIAAQLQSIRAAKNSNSPSCRGRVELPDNLKILVRPVAMMVPDFDLIAEIILFSKGFKSAKTLSRKIVHLYQAHAGVMLVGPTGGGKTTIRLILQHALDIMPALSNRRTSTGLNKGTPGLYVDCFTINAKCVDLGELFGQMNPNTLEWSDGLLASAIRAYAKELSQVDKRACPPSDELTSDKPIPGPEPPSPTGNSYQGMHGIEKWRWVIMDGPVDSLWVESLNTALDESRTLCLMNGERISLPEGLSLLLEVDSLSHATPATVSRCAMVYVDPLGKTWKLYVRRWLSQLPQALQDQGVAYLQKLFFGTVNQGVAFVNKHQKLLSFAVPELSLVTTLCSILSSIFNLLQKNGGFDQIEAIPSPWQNVSKTSPSSGTNVCPSVASKTREEIKWILQKYPDKLTSLLGKLYVFAYTWAFGGPLNHVNDFDDSHITFKEKSDPLVKVSQEFQSLLRELFDGGQHYGITLPSGNHTLFSYFVDLQTDAFVLWDELVPTTDSLIRKGLTPCRHEALTTFHAMYSGLDAQSLISQHVPSVDSIRYSFLLSLLLLNNQPTLLTGEPGVGKSMLIESILKKLQKDQGEIGNPSTIFGQVFLHHQAKSASLLEDVSLLTDGFTDTDHSGDVVSADLFGRLPSVDQPGAGPVETGILTRTFQCTAHTGPLHIKAHVLQGLTKRGKNILGAPKNKKVLIFLDDINMPVPDSAGDQPSMELLRQFIEVRGVHDAKTLTWKGIQDVTFCAACAPPGGGRQHLSRRLLRHFSVLVLPHPSYYTMAHIFQVQLGTFFGSGDFCKEVQQCREPLVSAAIAIYVEMCHTMLPTPARYHYTFNLRDLSKVIHGLMQCHSSELKTKEAAACLLAHEASRVFQDRLMVDKDRMLFHQILANELQIYFKVVLFSKVFWSAETLMKEPVMFADFLDPSIPPGSRIYKHIWDQSKILTVLDDSHKKHCKAKSQVSVILPLLSISWVQSPMVFFREAVEHVTRAARIFRQQGAHMMLIGLDGTGKQSCVTLACHLAACQLHRLSVSRNCSYTDFRDDLKKVFHLAGIQQKNTVLLITDSEILKDSVMKDLDCLLKCGDAPGLFNSEDMDTITSELQIRGSTYEKREEAYAHFIEQVRQRLHIVLALSPAGSRLRHFCWAHPALLGCCNIDWYSPWSKESLLQVAKSTYINSEDFYCPGMGLQDSVARACVDMHYSISQMAERYGQEARRPYYVVPSIFSEYMCTFTKMFRSREGELHSIRNRYTKGLTVLSEATSLITVMKEELAALSQKIEEKTEEIEILMAKLQKDADVVEQVRAIVQMEEDIMAQETQIVQDYAQEAQADLNTALPLLEKAIAALDALDKTDISEIRQV